MQIVIENLPRDISEEEMREALSPFAPVDKIALVKEGNMPGALIEIDTTRADAEALALRIDGHLHKGQRLHAWVPLRDEEAATEQQSLVAWGERNLADLDHEIARLAVLCRVKILDRGVIERVLQNDTSVCGTHNPVAFAKLHNMLMLHFAIRQKGADALGQAQMAAIETYIIERLKKAFPDLAGPWPPA